MGLHPEQLFKEMSRLSRAVISLPCVVWESFRLSCPLSQTVEHGFPHQPSALAFDPKLQLMAIGTKSGAIKVYPFFYPKLELPHFSVQDVLKFTRSTRAAAGRAQTVVTSCFVRPFDVVFL